MPTANLRRASWIWSRDVHPNQYVAALRRVTLPAAPRRATLHLFADAKYKLYVNGRFAGAGPAPFRKPVIQVDALDLAPFLRWGPNTVLVVAHFVGETTKYNTAEQPGLLAALDVALSGGRRLHLATDARWRVAELDCWTRQTPRRTWALESIEDVDLARPAFRILARHAGEDYAAGAPRAEPARLWRAPAVFARPDLELRTRLVPPLRWRREDVTRPRTVFRTNTEIYSLQDNAVRLDHDHAWPDYDERVYEMTRGGAVRFARRAGEPGMELLYDMGRMCAGEAAMEIVCEAPCTVDLALAEALRADGRPIVWRNGGLHYARYRLVAGVNRVRAYHFNGHRYLLVVVKDAVGAVEVRHATTHHCRADLEFRDAFAAEDRDLESLYRISRRSLALNTQAYPYDCNTREQGTYWGDGVWIADSVGHQTGDFRHLRHLAYALTEEVRACGPLIPASLYGLGGPLYDYCLVAVETLWRCWRYTADRAAVTDNLEAARAIVAAFRGYRDAEGWVSLAKIPPAANAFRNGLLFLDHPGMGWHPMTTVGHDRRDPNIGLNLFYLQALQALLGLEGALGRRAPALAREAETLRRQVQRRGVDAATGLVVDRLPAPGEAPRFSQVVNALAVLTGVLEGVAARHALAAVLDVPRHPWISQGTPYTYFFLAEAAARTGLARSALDAFRRDFQPMLARGATTTWEAWRAENHDSLNHAWSAPLPYLVRRGAMGLAPAAPGYAQALLAPQVDAFDTFDARCRIPQGEVAVAWTRVRPGACDLRVTLPRGVEGVLLAGGTRHRVRGTWAGIVAHTPA